MGFRFGSRTLIVIPLIHTLEIKSPSIVEILPGKDNRIQVSGMSIRDWVTYIRFVRYYRLWYQTSLSAYCSCRIYRNL